MRFSKLLFVLFVSFCYSDDVQYLPENYQSTLHQNVARGNLKIQYQPRTQQLEISTTHWAGLPVQLTFTRPSDAGQFFLLQLPDEIAFLHITRTNIQIVTFKHHIQQISQIYQYGFCDHPACQNELLHITIHKSTNGRQWRTPPRSTSGHRYVALDPASIDLQSLLPQVAFLNPYSLDEN